MSEYTRLISESKPKARKEYHCDAFLILENDIYAGSELEKKFTESERKDYDNAKAKKGRIIKGEIYLNQSCEFQGDIYRFKARPEIWDICKKYKIGFD